MPLFLINTFAWLRGLKPKTILIALGAAALAFFVWKAVDFVDDKYAAEAKVEELQDAVEDIKETIKVMEDIAAQKQRAQDLADAARDQIEGYRDDYDAISREALAATEEENGTVAPVLRRTLDALDSM